MKFKVISLILCVVLIICCFNIFKEIKSSGILDISKDQIEINENDKNEKEAADNKETKPLSEENKKIINILLLGIDKGENASDTIMIFSLNKEKNTVKLTSIMRDTYVYQGEGMANKINYAYNYGGVEGSINTVNEVFNLDISKYATVKFDDLINIVDKLGGIEINITEKERQYINENVSGKLNESGNVLLNGEQVLAYARMRKIDSDFNRTARQRKVMLAVFHKVKNENIIKYFEVISNLYKSVETNLTLKEILDIGYNILSLDENNLEEFRIPMDGTTKDNTEGVYHLDWDRDVNVKALHDYIYN